MGAVFLLDDDDSLITLQMLAAANDMRSALRIFVAANHAEAELPERPKPHHDGDRLYSLRLALMHLHELYRFINGRLFRQFFERRRAKYGDDAANRAQALKDRLNAGSFDEFLSSARNGATAHYFEDTVRVTLGHMDLNQTVGVFDSQKLEQHMDAVDALWSAVLGNLILSHFPGETVRDRTKAAYEELAITQQTVIDLATEMLFTLYRERVSGE